MWRLGIALAIVASSFFAQAPNEKSLVYSGATLIDGTGATPRAQMAIVTKGERITAVVPVAELHAPAETEVVDVSDQFVLPGLINAHEHLATPPRRRFAEAMMRRDLYGGVTAVRCMGDDSRALADLARASRVGEIPGPDIYYAALFAGPEFIKDARVIASTQGATAGQTPWMQAIDEKTDLATAVTLARGTGAIGIKIYADLSASLVAKIVREAHRQGMLAWAHSMVFPATPQEVLDAGPDVVSHIGYFGYQAMSPRPQRYEERGKFPIDSAPFRDGKNEVMARLFRQMKEKDIILDATVYVYHTIEQMRARDPNNAPPPPFCSSALAEILTAQAHREGVPIAVGTDSFSEDDDPYPAEQSEIELLVRRAGLTPLEAIHSATMIGARTMHLEKDMGSIEVGKLANLVFLEANPIDDIAAVRTLTMTVKRGVQFPRSDYRPIEKAEIEEKQ